MNLSDAELKAVRTQANKDKAKRAERNRKKPKAQKVRGATSISPPGVIGSAISGSGTAKVRAHKSRNPQQSRTEQAISMSPAWSGDLNKAESRPEILSPSGPTKPTTSAQLPDEVDPRFEFTCPSCNQIKPTKNHLNGFCEDCTQ